MDPIPVNNEDDRRDTVFKTLTNHIYRTVALNDELTFRNDNTE